MKVKLFEDFSQEIFHRVDGINSEWSSRSTGEPFSMEELRVMNKYYPFYHTDFNSYCYRKITHLESDAFIIHVFKLKDDWYWVYIVFYDDSENYECDQLDGLEECLKMIKTEYD